MGKRKTIILIVCAVFLIAAGFSILLSPKTDFTAPPHAKEITDRLRERNIKTLTAGFPSNPSSSSYPTSPPLKYDLPHSATSWPPNQPFPDFSVVHRGPDIQFVLEEPNSLALVSPSPIPSPYFGDAQIKSKAPAKLANGAELSLFAFGLRVPNAIEQIPVFTFRKFSDQSVLHPRNETEAPIEFFSKTTLPKSPELRLIYHSKNLPIFRDTKTFVIDQWTERSVGRVVKLHSQGDWHYVDIELSIWHDTNLAIGLDLLTGMPQEETLLLNTNEQVPFGDRFRLGFLYATEGESTTWDDSDPYSEPIEDFRVLLVGHKDPFADPSDLPVKGPNGSSLFFARPSNDSDDQSIPTFHKHCVFRGASQNRQSTFLKGIKRDGSSNLEAERIYFPGRRIRMGDQLQVTFYPYRTRVWVNIETLDMPNASDIENLFDVKIPAIELKNVDPFRPPYAVYDSGLFSPIANSVEFDILSETYREIDLSEYFPDGIARNTSPRELLELYIKNAPHAKVEIDPAKRQITISERASLIEKLKQNWEVLKGKWF